MKNIGNLLVSNLHIFLLLYSLWGLFEVYEKHTEELTNLETEIPDLRMQITKNKQKMKEIEDFMKKADEYKVRVEEVAKNIESVQRQLPAETNDSQIIGFLQEEMRLLNLRDASIMPGKETPTQYLISRDYNLKATGTFLQFLIFIERIGNASRIYNVPSLKLTSTDNAKRGRFQVISGEATIQAYRYNPDFKVDRTLDTQVK